MRRQHYISFNIPRDHGDRIRAALAEIECEHWWKPPPNERGLPSFENLFDSEDPRLCAVIELVQREGFKPFERIDHVYTDQERRIFPLLHLMVERGEIHPFGPSHGTTYDLLEGCQRCGCGAVQTSPFYAPRRSFPKTGLIVQSSTETFVAERLADALQCATLTGLELRQVHSHPDREPLPWWQLMPRITMPRMNTATKGLVRGNPPPCTLCRRDGHYHTAREPETIVYARKDIDCDVLPDVVQTWECFGKSHIEANDFRRSRFAEPAILVQPRVFDIIRKLKVKHARFAPVRIVD